MLHSATAALSKLGLSPKTHTGIIRAFGQNLVKTATINKTHGENLTMAKDIREKGDYSPYYTTSKETARALLLLFPLGRLNDKHENYQNQQGNIRKTV